MMGRLLHKALSPLSYALGHHKRSWLKTAEYKPLTAVLCYHRVVAHAHDNDGLFNVEKGITAKAFEQQMRFMLKHFEPIAPSAVTLKHKNNNQLRFTVTFDDGYLDNYTVALPILQKLGIKAAFYVVSDPLQTGEPFWWETLGQLLRASPLKSLRVFELFPSFVEHNYCTENLPLHNARLKERAHAQLSRGFLNSPPLALQPMLSRLARALETPIEPITRQLPLMTVKHLQELVSKGFEIGGHTANHVNLGTLEPSFMASEIGQSIKHLEQLINTQVRTFAFPYGGVAQQSEAAIELLRQTGLDCAFTTEKRLVTSQDSHFQLPRLQLNHPWAFACSKNINDAFNRCA